MVIGTNLFSRAAKKKKSKSANAQLPQLDEEYEKRLGELKDVLVGKLTTLTKDLTSAGVKDYLAPTSYPRALNSPRLLSVT